jgi:TatD DNase family protein
VNAGYFLSFTGIITYPKSEHIRDTVKNCPLAQLMIETDAPFLAPVPHRGKRNEPAFVTEVAKAVAEIKAISMEEVDRITEANALEFFGLTSP